MRRRQLQAHLVHGIGNDLRYRKVAEPLVVRRNDIPGRSLRAGQGHGVLIRIHVLRPQLALGIVAVTDLPIPRRIVESLGEAGQLLLRADVEVELQDARAVCHQHLLEVVDQVVAFRPHRMRDELVHAHHQDILVMRTVEDNHLAFARRAEVGAPEKVVRGFLLAGLLESEHRRALRVHPAEHVPDDPIFAGRVERLQCDEQRLIAVGVQQVLQLRHAFDVPGDLGSGRVMGLVFARVGRIDLRQAHLRTGLDQEFLAIIHAVSPVTPALAAGAPHSPDVRSSPAGRSDRSRSAR